MVSSLSDGSPSPSSLTVWFSSNTLSFSGSRLVLSISFISTDSPYKAKSLRFWSRVPIITFCMSVLSYSNTYLYQLPKFCWECCFFKNPLGLLVVVKALVYRLLLFLIYKSYSNSLWSSPSYFQNNCPTSLFCLVSVANMSFLLPIGKYCYCLA